LCRFLDPVVLKSTNGSITCDRFALKSTGSPTVELAPPQLNAFF